MKLCGRTVLESLSSHRETARFDSWFNHRKILDSSSPLNLSCPQREAELFQLLEVREVKDYKRKKLKLERCRNTDETGDGGVEEAENAPPAAIPEVDVNEEVAERVPETSAFSISEFARLCIIMRDDEDAKCAFGGTGQELTRSQIDAGFTRDSYWGVIESRFNDSDVRLHLNMTANVDDVNSALPPPCHRSASFLKDKFLEARKSFTTRIANWSESGQNDNADFKRFSGARKNDLTAEGKHSLVLFVYCRKGTENENTRFSKMCSRVIPFGRGYDEGGAPSEGSASMMGSRKRRKSANENPETEFERSFITYSEIAVAEKSSKVSARAEKESRRKRSDAETSRRRYLEDRQWFVTSMGNLHVAMKSQGLAPDSTFEECAHLQMQDHKKAFMMPQPACFGLPCEMPQSDEGARAESDLVVDTPHRREISSCRISCDRREERGRNTACPLTLPILTRSV